MIGEFRLSDRTNDGSVVLAVPSDRPTGRFLRALNYALIVILLRSERKDKTQKYIFNQYLARLVTGIISGHGRVFHNTSMKRAAPGFSGAQPSTGPWA
jgi:hypothetical protein